VTVPRIVYLCREMSEYIRIEIDLFRERHDVTVIGCASRWPRPLFLLRRLAGIGYGHRRGGLRRIVPLSWMLADVLSRIPLLQAFYLVGIRKRGVAGRGRLRACRD
jgi:hypothetical protein